MRIDHATLSGTFSLDGQTLNVDNNVWLVGDNTECVVIDAPHDTSAILDLVAGRTVTAILLTHGHDDHIGAVGALWDATGAPICLHPADRMLWNRIYPGVEPDVDLVDGQMFTVAGVALQVLHTPGHSPGSVCFHAPELATVFTGDTLVGSGYGRASGSFSDHLALVASVRAKLLAMPPDVVARPGHGPSATIRDIR